MLRRIYFAPCRANQFPAIGQCKQRQCQPNCPHYSAQLLHRYLLRLYFVVGISSKIFCSILSNAYAQWPLLLVARQSLGCSRCRRRRSIFRRKALASGNRFQCAQHSRMAQTYKYHRNNHQQIVLIATQHVIRKLLALHSTLTTR